MSPPAAPRVSVIVPCYDLGPYLDEAVESVLAQSYQDFEIIVVDDGSTDPETQAIIGEYRRPKTRVIRAAHGGLASARNTGIAHAQGELLCALDADDRLAPSFLEKTVRAIDDDPAITFASCWLRAFGDEAWEWRPERCDLPTLLSENTVLTAAVVRRAAVASVGGYDAAMPVQGDEDWDLWLTLVERGFRGVIVPEVLFDYRRRAGSMSTICWHGAGHLPLARYRLAKHADTYRAHLKDVLLRQDAETAVLLRRNDELERYIATDLEPSVALRRQEITSLRSRFALASAPADAEHAESPVDAARIRHLDAALNAAAAEVTALRNSASWGVTAPLRRLYGWWLGMRGPS
jgi:glycosyltransferase involved in cell wall biosynthesis